MNSTFTFRSAALAALAALSLAACDDAAVDGLAFDVTEPGEFAIGYRATELSYTLPGRSSPRTIPIRVWYPVSRSVAERMNDAERALYFYRESDVAIVDAPPADPAFDGGFPVVVHSHGHAGYPEQSYPIFEWLAANGFVVIAPGHVGDMTADVAAGSYHEYFASRAERIYDVQEALDYLEELGAGDPLAGLVNTERAIITGHSRGTHTVWASLGATITAAALDAECASGEFDAAGGCTAADRALYESGTLHDPRFVAGIPMAGSGDMSWFGGTAGMNAVSAAIFQMTGSANPVGADTIFAQVTNPPMLWLDYANGCHNVFGFPLSCGAAVDDADATRSFGTYATAFARRELFADDDATVASVLDGSRIVSNSVSLQSR